LPYWAEDFEEWQAIAFDMRLVLPEVQAVFHRIEPWIHNGEDTNRRRIVLLN
jgi:hypothetical protein